MLTVSSINEKGIISRNKGNSFISLLIIAPSTVFSRYLSIFFAVIMLLFDVFTLLDVIISVVLCFCINIATLVYRMHFLVKKVLFLLNFCIFFLFYIHLIHIYGLARVCGSARLVGTRALFV